jgi:hypothetical protein
MCAWRGTDVSNSASGISARTQQLCFHSSSSQHHALRVTCRLAQGCIGFNMTMFEQFKA